MQDQVKDIVATPVRPAGVMVGENGAVADVYEDRQTNGVPRNGPFYALTFRNFRLFFSGQLISLAGTWMQLVAQQWLVFSLTKSAAWLGIVTGVSALPTVLFSLLGGHVADRYPRRNILLITQIAAMLLACVLTLLATNWWIPIQPWHLAVLAGLMGVVNAFNMPAQQALVPEMVESRAALGNAIALNSLMFNIARFLGPVLAGIALVRFGPAACFGLNAVSYLAVIASLLMIRLPQREVSLAEQSPWEGFRFINRVRSVLRTMLLVGTASLLIWSISTLFPVLATQFGQGASGYTTIMAVNGIGAAVGGILIATFGDRVERRYLVYGAPIVFCAVFIALSFITSYWLALFCIFLAGISMITFGVNAQTKVQQEVTDALRGRVMAVYSLIFSGLMPLGGLLIGFVAEHIGALHAIRINAILCLVIALSIFTWSQRETRAVAGDR